MNKMVKALLGTALRAIIPAAIKAIGRLVAPITRRKAKRGEKGAGRQ